MSAPRPARFHAQPTDLCADKDIDQNVDVIYALFASIGIGIDGLLSGLKKEKSKYSAMSMVWDEATKWFNANKSKNSALRQPGIDDAYHIALISYAMEGFYGELNKQCRELKTKQDVKRFPYPYYWKILTLAIMKVTGSPVYPSNVKLYRGCGFEFSGIFPSSKVGGSFAFKHFTSTTAERKVAENFAANMKRTIFILDNVLQRGCDISHQIGLNGNCALNCVSMNQHSPYAEHEVLIWSIASFKITNIVKNQNLTEVYLQA